MILAAKYGETILQMQDNFAATSFNNFKSNSAGFFFPLIIIFKILPLLARMLTVKRDFTSPLKTK